MAGYNLSLCVKSILLDSVGTSTRNCGYCADLGSIDKLLKK